MTQDARLGATLLGDRRCRFEVWAPSAERVEVCLADDATRCCAMQRAEDGYFTAMVDDVDPQARYRYRLHDGDQTRREHPDPASRFQPDGVHGPSQVVDDDFKWSDPSWPGLPLSRYVLYELHVGTFTAQGTFDGVIEHLEELAHLGITAIELMPVAQFPGGRNWGYDGVYPFAAQNTYGGPLGLKRLVDACHANGLAVVLDVVYNHLGPEGNYLGAFGPYFTDFYRTPWGAAINFDGPFSDEVRRYFIENALYWVDECRIDALRLDAVHAILDFSARPFLEQLAEAAHHRAEALNRRIHLIAESALNDTRIIRPRELGGFAIDAQWNDDFHHSLHTALTGEQSGYYRDFNGLDDLARAWREGYVYSGQYSAFRQRSHGNTSRSIPARQMVVFAQNHDQVGNRMLGDRLSGMVPFEKLKLAAGLVTLSPFVPLLFMGEEYGESAPFLYFTSHGDPDLVQAVRDGRRQEFEAFAWQSEPPDPQDVRSFEQSRLDHTLRGKGRHRQLYDFYRALLDLRAGLPALANLSKKQTRVTLNLAHHLLCVQRRADRGRDAWLIFSFERPPGTVPIDSPPGVWRKRLDSAEERWGGQGSTVPDRLAADTQAGLDPTPNSVVVFSRETDPDPPATNT